MKLNVVCSIALLAGCVLIMESSFADSRENCSQRRVGISRQLEQAEAADNVYRVAGLQQALANVERYCREPSADEDRSINIQKAEAEVRRRQNHLKAARQYGDVKVIKKHEARLARAEAKLRSVLNE
ncbi:DUF1090 domain-containing protein [Pseudomonas sp. SM4]|uniref:DUF1090 domain-containing protein n=1 Tax=Pseudomonas sp. SM4 TaxID=3424177 RepID=UPI003F7A539C